MNKTTQLKCPTCGTTVLWNDDYPFRPFCCKRCQQIDFGDWALEKHSIPGEPVIDHSQDDESGVH